MVKPCGLESFCEHALHSTLLYSTNLSYATLHSTLLCLLYSTILCYTLLYYTTLHYTTLYYNILQYALLCYAMLYSTLLCSAICHALAHRSKSHFTPRPHPRWTRQGHFRRQWISLPSTGGDRPKMSKTDVALG